MREGAGSPLPLRGGAGGGGSPSSAAFAASPHPNPSPEGEGLSGGRFGAAALALAGEAARVLGWRAPEFWAATPAELAAALGLLARNTDAVGLDRETLHRLMEHDHDR